MIFTGLSIIAVPRFSMHTLNKLNLTLSILATATITGLAAINGVQAGPTLPPPNGNPAFPAGPQGPQGSQGNTGNQGPQGSQGSQGSQGAQGLYGIGSCNWGGGEFVSYGWDGGCAWNIGAYFYCDGSRLYRISYRNVGCGDSGTYPSTPAIN